MTEMTEDKLSLHAKIRYQRQMSLKDIGVKGQCNLLKSRVMLIGFGALGQACAQYLVAAGIGHIVLFDPDKVEISNLHRQPLFCPGDAGRLKVDVARDILKKQNPDVTIEAYHEAFSLTHIANSEHWDAYDLLIDGSDNLYTRYIASDFAIKTKRPLIHASILRYNSMITIFKPLGPCYRCLFPDPPSKAEIPSCAEAGVIGPLPGIIGSMMALEAIKILLDKRSPLEESVLFIDGQSLAFKYITKAIEEHCPACQKKSWSILTYPDASKKLSAINEITVEDAWKTKDQFVWVDIREEAERVQGSIPGSLFVNQDEIKSKLSELKDHSVILFCQRGKRSLLAIDKVSKMENTKFYSLKGGYIAWLNHQLQTEKEVL